MVFEVDCLEIVYLWYSRTGSRAVIAPIFQDIEGLVFEFDCFVIQHVMRASNTLAHLCAKHACTLEATNCWMELPPSFLVSSPLADRDGAVFV